MGIDVEALHRATALYTEADVVAGVLAAAGWPRAGALLDPSCGDGAFLVAAIAALAPAPGSDVASRIAGIEIHPGSADEARDGVEAALVALAWPRDRAQAAARAMVRTGDFLTVDPTRFATIVGNPPYVRYAHLPDAFKARYASLPSHERADLQNAFLARCARIAEGADARIAMITSDRWLSNATAGPLRAAVGLRFRVGHCERLDAATSFRRPKRRTGGTPPRVHPVRIVLGPEGRTIGSRAFAVEEGADLAGPTLSDHATVRLGPWLGSKGGFTFGRDVMEALLPHVRVERGGVSIVPAATARDVGADGRLRPPSTWALLTRPDHEPGEALRRHLEAAGPLDARRWWMPRERATLDLASEAIVVPRIARTIRAVRLEPGRLPVDHALYVVSSGSMAIAEIAAALTGEEAAEHARRNAPRLEDGYLDIRASLIRTVPLPRAA